MSNHTKAEAGRKTAMPPDILQKNVKILQNNAIVNPDEPNSIYINLNWFTDKKYGKYDGEWSKLSHDAFTKKLIQKGVRKEDANTILTELQTSTKTIRLNRSCIFNELPLYPAGIHTTNAKPFLVCKTSPPAPAEKGDCKIALRLLHSAFGNELPIVLGMLQGMLMRQQRFYAVQRGEKSPYEPMHSQTLVIMGPPSSGKTEYVVKSIIAPLLGGCSLISPTWYTGINEFNGWAAEAPLYVGDDLVTANIHRIDRKTIASRLKALAYAGYVCVERKGRDTVKIDFPNERVLTFNMTEEAARYIPDPDADPDKFVFVYCEKSRFIDTMPKDELVAKLRACIPALAYFLLHVFEPPAWLKENTTRHNILDTGYISPVIKDMVSGKNSHASALMNKLYALVSSDPSVVGTSLDQEQLRKALEKQSGESLNMNPVAFGKCMACVINQYSTLVSSSTSNGRKRFRLAPADEWHAVRTARNRQTPPLDKDFLEQLGLSDD